MGKLGKGIVALTILVLATIVSISLTRKPDLKPETTDPIVEKTVKTEFTASFEIYTNGTKRIFSDSKYHDLSPTVYIQNPNPSTVYVRSSGITWDDFFKTLPMKLTSECLTTGTGQFFCTGENGKLQFFINDTEDPDALEKVINPNDILLVIYK